jgi:hypothetical protein
MNNQSITYEHNNITFIPPHPLQELGALKHQILIGFPFNSMSFYPLWEHKYM